MYPTNVGIKYLIQQTVSGTGGFTGVEYGRARLTMDPGVGANGIVYFASKLYGSASNAITVRYLDTGAGTTVTATTVQQVGSAITVVLRRTSGAITATALEIAAAINAFTTYTGPAFAIRARAGGTGLSVVTALAATAFTGGADPTIEGTQYRWDLPTNDYGGFIHLEQEFPAVVLGFAMKLNVLLPGPFMVVLQRVRIYPDFTLVAGSEVNEFVFPELTPAASDIAFSGGQILLHPGEALMALSSVPMTGFLKLDVQRASQFAGV